MEVGARFLLGLAAGWLSVMIGVIAAVIIGIHTDTGLIIEGFLSYIGVGVAAGVTVYAKNHFLMQAARLVIAGFFIGIIINMLFDYSLTLTAAGGYSDIMIGDDISTHVFWVRVLMQTLIGVPIGVAFGMMHGRSPID